MAFRKDISITESTIQLKQLFRSHPIHLQSRIQMLFLIQSNITHSTSKLSERLFVHRRVIQSWKNLYALGGISTLLNYQRGKGKKGVITPAISEKIKEQLSSPTSAFTSFKQLQQWVQENHLPNVSYRIVNHHAKNKLKASLKVARKSHIKKNPELVEAFKKKLSLA